MNRATEPENRAAPRIPGVVLGPPIGRGGMGTVYRGAQSYLGRDVAVKVLDPGLTGSLADEFHRRFEREARALAELSHPHIVACHQAGITDDGRPYLVMELVDGPDLLGWIREHGRVPAAAALRFTSELASALEHAWARGLVHRDVKPGNVLLAKTEAVPADGVARIAKLVDLGLVRPHRSRVDDGDADITSVGVAVGTPNTMAPEQVTDPEAVDHRADIYGLGCVLFTMLTAEPLFRGPAGQVLMRKTLGADARDAVREAALPRPIEALLTELLATDPADRPADAAALRAAITAARAAIQAGPDPSPANRLEEPLGVESDPLAEAVTGKTPVPTSFPPRSPWPAWQLTLVAVGIMAAFSAAALLRRPDPPPAQAPTLEQRALLFPPGAALADPWVVESGAFELSPRGGVLVARGTAAASRPLPAPPWRVRGYLIGDRALQSARGPSVGVALEGGVEVAISARMLTPPYAAITRSDRRPPLVQLMPVLGEVVEFSITATDARHLLVEIPNATGRGYEATLMIEAAPRALRIAIDSERGEARFRDLELWTPRPATP